MSSATLRRPASASSVPTDLSSPLTREKSRKKQNFTSTLYNAVMEAGLDVTERSPHYAQLPYIRLGLDATVWFGDEYGKRALPLCPLTTNYRS